MNNEAKTIKEPFHFCTRMHLSALTGFKAADLHELLTLIREVPGSSIYYHTHHFLQQHQYLSPEPPNDFAYWTREVLGEEELGERLASIDIMQYATIRDLREKIASTIENFLQKDSSAARKFAREGEEFVFIRSVSFIAWTNYYASDLKEFAEILRKITVDAIYFHVFESRLRLGKAKNDFSHWIETSVGDKELADKIAALDPYTQTMEDLRKTILQAIETRNAPWPIWQKSKNMLRSLGRRP